MDRVIAIDWSGALARDGRGGIALAEVAAGSLTRLDTDLSRTEAVDHLIALDSDDRVLAGMDFAFSFPSWYLHKHGYRRTVDFWRDLAGEGDSGAESILARCEPPFWGRPGKLRPHGPEADCRRTTLQHRAKPVFQIGGAGSVGTGSLRGMPHLLRLREGGWSIFPFDDPGQRTAVEIYTSILYRFAGIESVRKSDPDSRARAIRQIRACKVPKAVEREAIANEHAFDALTAAIGLWNWTRSEAFAFPTPDPTDRLEGMIFPPT